MLKKLVCRAMLLVVLAGVMAPITGCTPPEDVDNLKAHEAAQEIDRFATAWPLFA